MAPFGIVYERGAYCYGPFRYDLLADALNYAKCSSGLPASEQQLPGKPANNSPYI
jgi:hypothetical protein